MLPIQLGPKQLAITFFIVVGFTIMVLMYESDNLHNYVYKTIINITSNYGAEIIDTYLNDDYENSTRGYLVWSPSCKIPEMDPYHSSIKKYLFKQKPLICSKKKALTFVEFNSTSRRHTLRVNESEVHDYSTAISDLTCTYSVIERKYLESRRNKKDDNRYNLGDVVHFHESAEVPESTEGIFVVCTSMGQEVYRTVHYMVADKKAEGSTLQPTSEQRFSVLLFGIDTISRMTSMRVLPKTREYLDQQGWIELRGYNKVRGATFSNMVAFLTGLREEQLVATCIKSWSNPLDDCPFIWRNFSANGYLTSYSEDAPGIGTFNAAKYGFLNSPTDYYGRPFVKAIEDLLPPEPGGHSYFCSGQKPKFEYLLEFAEEFLRRFHDRRYFKLLWANTFSHDDVNMAAVMDLRLRQLLRAVQPHLHSTVVVFFSDHGSRWGDLRGTRQGWLEEKLPLLYVHLPPAARPAHRANLRANARRLTSPFDLHATLRHLLDGRAPRPPPGCATCGSLLEPLPDDRRCAQAGVPVEACACAASHARLESAAEPRFAAAARLAVRLLNARLAAAGPELRPGSRCAALTLRRVESARSYPWVVGDGVRPRRLVVVVFRTEPGDGLFELAVLDGDRVRQAEAISRINAYGGQSACVQTDPNLKPICFCIEDK